MIDGLFSKSTADNCIKKSEKKILIIVSSQDKKAEPDVVAGFWFPELTHPARIFDQAGYDIEIASPRGGMTAST